MKVNTKLCAAFCGTGKSSLCKQLIESVGLWRHTEKS